MKALPLKSSLLAFVLGLMPLAPMGANAGIVDSVQLYAQEFVGNCLDLANTDADRKAALGQAGFRSTMLGWRKSLDDYSILVAAAKSDGFCTLRFLRVGPKGELMRAAIDAQLAKLGYSPIGETVPVAMGNTMNGSGAHQADIYAHGKQLIAVEQGGPSYGLQSFGIQRYLK